jgi:hypothetical protein
MITDADWAEVNKLRRAYDSGGDEAQKRAYEALCKDLTRWVRVMSAFHSDYVRAKVDAYAALGFFYTKPGRGLDCALDLGCSGNAQQLLAKFCLGSARGDMVAR